MSDCGFCEDGIIGGRWADTTCPYCNGTGKLPLNDDGYDPEDHPHTHGDSRFFGSRW